MLLYPPFSLKWNPALMLAASLTYWKPSISSYMNDLIFAPFMPWSLFIKDYPLRFQHWMICIYSTDERLDCRRLVPQYFSLESWILSWGIHNVPNNSNKSLTIFAWVWFLYGEFPMKISPLIPYNLWSGFSHSWF